MNKNPEFSATNFLKCVGAFGKLTDKDARYLAKKLKEDERDAVAMALMNKDESTDGLTTEYNKVLSSAFNVKQ